MKIYSVYDPEFKPYGQIVTGMEDTVAEILNTLKDAPCGEAVDYVPTWEPLQKLPAAEEVSLHCYGGMPVQLGWCNGHNSKLNCLEYHRDSELNYCATDLILLLGLEGDIDFETYMYDTAKVEAFLAPKGTLLEVYATALHYAPINAGGKFRCTVVLPKGTNTELQFKPDPAGESRLLTATNKWLLPHPDSPEAKGGAVVALKGENPVVNY